MSTMLSAQRIDPWESAQQQQHLCGDIALSAMPRLSASLERAQGSITIDWQFALLEQHIVVNGSIDVSVYVRCQRCLQALQWSTSLPTTICLLKPGQTEQNAPADYEVVALSETPVALSELVEDEIVLALPFAPVHEQCPAHDYVADEQPSAEFSAAQQEAERENPFLALAALKQDR